MKLAQSKVSQVESECHNQNLQHQLNTLIAKTTLQPSSTTSHSWKTKWDNVVNNIPNVAIPTFQSHISEIANQLNSFDETK